MLEIRSGAGVLLPLLQQAGDAVGELLRRDLGAVVTDRRSSFVRRRVISATDCYIKVYAYPRWRDQLRGALRNTGPGRPSRAAREAQALEWLRQHGFEAPTPIAVLEDRKCGWLRAAVLVTAAWPGEALDRLLPQLDAAARRELAAALVAFVRGLHAAGFRDRNLDLRNLLARRTDDRWQLAKLDSPRFRLRPPGRAGDALARADWRRLLPQLAQHGCAPEGTGP